MKRTRTANIPPTPNENLENGTIHDHAVVSLLPSSTSSSSSSSSSSSFSSPSSFVAAAAGHVMYHQHHFHKSNVEDTSVVDSGSGSSMNGLFVLNEALLAYILSTWLWLIEARRLGRTCRYMNRIAKSRAASILQFGNILQSRWTRHMHHHCHVSAEDRKRFIQQVAMECPRLQSLQSVMWLPARKWISLLKPLTSLRAATFTLKLNSFYHHRYHRPILLHHHHGDGDGDDHSANDGEDADCEDEQQDEVNGDDNDNDNDNDSGTWPHTDSLLPLRELPLTKLTLVIEDDYPFDVHHLPQLPALCDLTCTLTRMSDMGHLPATITNLKLTLPDWPLSDDAFQSLLSLRRLHNIKLMHHEPIDRVVTYHHMDRMASSWKQLTRLDMFEFKLDAEWPVTPIPPLPFSSSLHTILLPNLMSAPAEALAAFLALPLKYLFVSGMTNTSSSSAISRTAALTIPWKVNIGALNITSAYALPSSFYESLHAAHSMTRLELLWPQQSPPNVLTSLTAITHLSALEIRSYTFSRHEMVAIGQLPCLTSLQMLAAHYEEDALPTPSGSFAALRHLECQPSFSAPFVPLLAPLGECTSLTSLVCWLNYSDTRLHQIGVSYPFVTSLSLRASSFGSVSDGGWWRFIHNTPLGIHLKFLEIAQPSESLHSTPTTHPPPPPSATTTTSPDMNLAIAATSSSASSGEAGRASSSHVPRWQRLAEPLIARGCIVQWLSPASY